MFLSTEGYVKVSISHTKSKYLHRLVYERMYNCCLLSWVDIHHIDGNKQNNEISNLKPFTKAQHMSIERTGAKMSKESRLKESLALKGRKFSEEHKKNISKAMIGKTNHRQPHSLETRRKISKSMKGKNI